jgi:hypothetical protein
MLLSVKTNNHVDNHQMYDVNHSVGELLFNMSVSFKTALLMVLMLNKLNQVHVPVLMEHNHYSSVIKDSSCVMVNQCLLNPAQVVPFGMILTKLVLGPI